MCLLDTEISNIAALFINNLNQMTIDDNRERVSDDINNIMKDEEELFKISHYIAGGLHVRGDG